jgi:hypothetical protein
MLDESLLNVKNPFDSMIKISAVDDIDREQQKDQLIVEL